MVTANYTLPESLQHDFHRLSELDLEVLDMLRCMVNTIASHPQQQALLAANAGNAVVTAIDWFYQGVATWWEEDEQ